MVVRQAFESRNLLINYTCVQRYPGGFIGSDDTESGWLEEAIANKWTVGVQTLACMVIKQLN